MEWLVTTIIALGFLGESVFGFGGGLIVIPLLSNLLGVRNAVTLTLLFQLLMGLLVILTYKNVYWKYFPIVAISIAVGSVIGTYSLAIIDENILRFVLTGFILLYLAKMYFFKKNIFS